MNLYGFVGNNGVNAWDLLGLAQLECNEKNVGMRKGCKTKDIESRYSTPPGQANAAQIAEEIEILAKQVDEVLATPTVSLNPVGFVVGIMQAMIKDPSDAGGNAVRQSTKSIVNHFKEIDKLMGGKYAFASVTYQECVCSKKRFRKAKYRWENRKFEVGPIQLQPTEGIGRNLRKPFEGGITAVEKTKIKSACDAAICDGKKTPIDVGGKPLPFDPIEDQN